MTEEQLNELKTVIKIRLEYCEEKAQEYSDKGGALEVIGRDLEGSVRAYKTVLEDIEKIISK